MNLDPAPRLNKLVFLAIDVGLLLTAFLVVFFAKNPYAPLPFVTAVLLVVAAAIVGLAPFFVDYSAKYDEYVQAEQLRVAEQAQRLHTAAESLNRAAAQIKSVEEAVHKSAHAAENLPYRMQEKLAEFNEALASKESDDRDALERELDELRAANSDQLKVIADRLTKATAEWSALESAQRKQLTAAQEAGQKLNEQLKATLAAIDARLADLRTAAAATPGPAPAPAAPAAIPAPPDSNESDSSVTAHPFAPTAAPFPVEPAAPASPIESVRLSEAALTPVEEPKPKKPRAPRKPKPEDTLAAMSAEPVVESAPTVESTTTTVASDESTTPSAVETSASSDGATRLLVTAYIGIGNKLFLRGEGPGLSWDKGVPMQFVSIGKWGWASHDVAGPVRCKLYKNDESAALSGEVTLQPGKHLELTALF